MSEITEHGQNIAMQIADEDVYGQKGGLTLADIYSIVDQIHTNLMDSGLKGEELKFLENFLLKLESMDEDLPVV